MKKIYVILVVVIVFLLATVLLVGVTKQAAISSNVQVAQSAQAAAVQKSIPKVSNANAAYKNALSRLYRFPGRVDTQQKRTKVLAELAKMQKEMSDRSRQSYNAALAKVQQEYEAELAEAQSDGEKRAADRKLKSGKSAAKKAFTNANVKIREYVNSVKANIESQYKVEMTRWNDSANRIKKELDIAYASYKSIVADAQKRFDAEREEASLDLIQRLEELMEDARTPDEQSNWTPSLGEGNPMDEQADQASPCADGETLIGGRCK